MKTLLLFATLLVCFCIEVDGHFHRSVNYDFWPWSNRDQKSFHRGYGSGYYHEGEYRSNDDDDDDSLYSFNNYPKSHHNYNPKPRPNFNSEYLPVSDPESHIEFHPVSDPKFYPEFDPKTNPDYHPVFDPKTNPDYHPVFDPKTNPDFDPDFYPNSNPDFHPVSDPVSHDKKNNDNIKPDLDRINDNEDKVEIQEENVAVRVTNLNLNINVVLDKIVIKPEPENPENPNVKVIEPEHEKKIKKKVKVNLNIENPGQIQSLVDKDKGAQLVAKLMDSIPKSAHQEEIANIFADTVKQAVENLDEEKARQGPNFSDGKLKISVIIDDPKHVESLIEEAGEEKMSDKLRNELSDNEMLLLDSVWGAVRRSAAKNR